MDRGAWSGVGCHFLLQGIFLTQESNPGLLHCTDPHSQEYVEHLKDKAQVCTIIEHVQRYLEEKGTTEICLIYLRHILHAYYKFDYKAHQRQLTPAEGSSKSEQDQAENEGQDSAVLMETEISLQSGNPSFLQVPP